jgi:hypothetical protein
MGLRASAISGILCALLSIPVGFVASVDGGLISNAGLPLLLYAFSILCIWPCCALYVHGFILLGRQHSNGALLASAYALYTVVIVTFLFLVVAFFRLPIPSVASGIVQSFLSVGRSSSELFVGTALFRARHELGSGALWTGIAADLAGAAGFFLSGNAFLFWIPFLLCGSWLLMKAEKTRSYAGPAGSQPSAN